MGELRNQLERRKPWLGFSGHQCAALIWMWFHSEGRCDCPTPGIPPFWQSRRALERKGVIRFAEFRGSRQNPTMPWKKETIRLPALTKEGWELCQRLLTAFPREAAEAQAEYSAYVRMFKETDHAEVCS